MGVQVWPGGWAHYLPDRRGSDKSRARPRVRAALAGPEGQGWAGRPRGSGCARAYPHANMP